MASTQTTQRNADVPAEMVTRVGAAAGLVARIQQEYAVQAEAEPGDHARAALADKARAAAEKVLDDKGLSVDEYNAVLAAAEGDESLEERLLDAARTVL